jgi:hypothetical protein
MSGCSKFQMLHMFIFRLRARNLVGGEPGYHAVAGDGRIDRVRWHAGAQARNYLQMLSSFKLGRSFEVGVTLLLAVTLDPDVKGLGRQQYLNAAPRSGSIIRWR